MKMDGKETLMYMFLFCKGGVTKIGYADRELSSDELEPLRELMGRLEFNGFRLLHNVLYVFDSSHPFARITGDIIEEGWRYMEIKEEVVGERGEK